MADLKPYQHFSHLQHGHTVGREYSPTYHSWQAMLTRCRYNNRDNSARYEGVSVCDRWSVFANFLADMGERPAGTTLDRYPNKSGNYEPSNCRWATPIEQARNTRKNRLTYDSAVQVALRRLRGESAASIAKDLGISESLPREIGAGRCWKDALAAAKQIIEEANGTT